MSRTSFSVKAAAALVSAAFLAPAVTLAGGGSSGPTVHYVTQGQIGELIGNPYKIAPLTAVIKNGGYVLKDATVRIVPKKGGQEIKYHVSDTALRTHAGIPVFGLYPDYVNTIEVSYTIVDGKKTKRVEKEVYRTYAPAVYTEINGSQAQHKNMFELSLIHISEPTRPY